MSTFYNDPTITYNDASTQYNGTPTIYTYAGSVVVLLTPAHAIETVDGADVFVYSGVVSFSLDPSSFNKKGATVVADIVGVSLAIGFVSTIVIRRYYKFADPVVVAGCPQCGTLLYNKRG